MSTATHLKCQPEKPIPCNTYVYMRIKCKTQILKNQMYLVLCFTHAYYFMDKTDMATWAFTTIVRYQT